MYTQKSENRFRNIDVSITDLICLNLAFFISYKIRLGAGNPYLISLYRNLIIVVCLLNMLAVKQFDFYSDIAKRGYYKELVSLINQSAVIFLLGVLYLYSTKEGSNFSRLMMVIMGCLFLALNYLCRILRKTIVRRVEKKGYYKSILIITDSEDKEKILRLIESNPEISGGLKGIVYADSDVRCDHLGGYPVVCPLDKATEFVCHNWVDEVFIATNNINKISEGVLKGLCETGVVVHIGLFSTNTVIGSRQLVESFAGCNVLTLCMKEASPIEIFLKRLMDICGGIIGCIIAGVIFLFLSPIIRRKSPGPVFFKQQRVGKNGKIFNVYKFRSMSMDAEKRKKELVAANRLDNGMMFKLDFDPRVIGNEIEPDGTQKRGIGDFIRRYSIDEFPQFFNVLKGDMSLVGTRPPTLDEWEKYETHHRARLAVKPGITGMWQVSGRSNITDFEEVVALDTKYINEWSLGLDIKIILKTFAVVFKRDGAL